MIGKVFCFALIVTSLCVATLADTAAYTWNYGTAIANPNFSSTTNNTPLLSLGGFSIGNSNGSVSTPISTTSASNNLGSSGQFNIGNAFGIGALNTSTSGYFQFSVTLSNSIANATLTDLDFGSRSTATGPQAFALRTSLNGYGSDVFSTTVPNNSTWALRNNSFAPLTLLPGSTVTFRIFGYNGTGNPTASTINGRIDDLTASFQFVAVPEPSSMMAVSLVGLALAGRFRRRR